MLIGKRPAWLPLTLAFVAFSLVFAEGAAAKCSPQMAMPGLERGEPVTLKDGLIVGTGILGDLFAEIDDPSNVHSGGIICWNPATGEFQPGGGISVIAIWTNGFVESTRAPIEALLQAQEAYFSQHSRYAQSLDDLVAFGVPQDAMLEFSGTSTGWSATTPRDDVAYRCFVYSGNATPELAEMKEHEVVCQTENAKASRALREMYEGSGEVAIAVRAARPCFEQQRISAPPDRVQEPGSSITIRGFSPIFEIANQPIYVIDGVRYDFEDCPLADLGPDDIEDMEVLMSAAAIRLFGEEAFNGAIVLTLTDEARRRR